MDKTLLLIINREWTNPFMDRLMATFTSADVWLPLLILGGLILLWRGNFKVRSFLLVTLLTIGFTDGIFTQFMKPLINRPRPSQALSEVREVNLEKTKPAILGVWRPVQVSALQTARGPGERAIVPFRTCHEQHRHSHDGYSVFREARSPLHHSRRNSVLLENLLRFALA